MRISGSTTGTSAVVHGMHPMRGYPVTCVITPVPGRPATFLVQSADGDIDDDDAWQYAAKESLVLSAEQTRELVAAVARRG
jgi:hypothetical protein